MSGREVDGQPRAELERAAQASVVALLVSPTHDVAYVMWLTGSLATVAYAVDTTPLLKILLLSVQSTSNG
jgi:hypothetical protein